MKKFLMIFAIIVVITLSAIYGYFNYLKNSNSVEKLNAEYEYYYEKEIYGAELATVINKAIDSNENFNIEKDNKGKYIENTENSIKIDVKIIDNDTIYDMETFYNAGIENFVNNYNTIQFKCTNIEYHSNTNRIKYMYFEQITQ